MHRSVQAPAKAKPLPRNVTRPLPTSKRRKREAKDEAGEEGRQRVVARCVGWGLLWAWVRVGRRVWAADVAVPASSPPSGRGLPGQCRSRGSRTAVQQVRASRVDAGLLWAWVRLGRRVWAANVAVPASSPPSGRGLPGQCRLRGFRFM